MKKNRKLLVGAILSIAIALTSLSSFAATESLKPAELVERLPGRGGETGLEMKKDKLIVQLEAGRITQEQADLILKEVEEMRLNCDGSGGNRIGQKLGAKFGSDGLGQGFGGEKRGQGQGRNRNLSGLQNR